MEDITFKINEEKKQEIVEIIVERKKKSFQSVANLHTIWEKCKQYYFSYSTKDKKYPWKNNIFVPISFEMVETVVPMIANSLLTVKPVIGVLPALSKDDEDRAKAMEEIIDFQLSNKFNSFDLKVEKWIRSAQIYGTGIMKVLPSGMINGRYYYPVLDNVMLKDFFIQPSALSIEEADWCGCIYQKTTQYLLHKYRDYINKDIFEEIKKSSKLSSEVSFWSRSDQQLFEGSQEITEYYGFLPIDDKDFEEQYVATIVNNKVLLRLIKCDNDFKRPFVVIQGVPVEDSIFGIGIIEPIIDLQFEINKRRNQRLDNIDESINIMWGVLRGCGVDLSQLVSRPNGVILYDVPDAVRPFTIPDITGGLHTENQITLEDIRRTLGIYPYSQGQPPVRRETASGIMTLIQAASVRYKRQIDRLNETGIEKLGELITYYNQKYLTSIVVRKLLNNGNYSWKTFMNSDIQGNFTFIASGASEEGLGNIEVRKMNYLKYFNLMMSLPPQIPLPDGKIVYINQPELIRRLAKIMGEKNIEKIIIEHSSPQTQQQLLPLLKGNELENIEGNIEGIPSGVVQSREVAPEGIDVASLLKSMVAKTNT